MFTSICPGMSKQTELILNSDGSVFHLHLLPEHIADTVILVGDPDRVKMVSDFFDHVEVSIRNREFVTHTGTCRNKRFTVISTGIGTDNIDIVINEIDALVNIDLATHLPKGRKKSLDFIRLGTSGAFQQDIPVGSFLLSEKAIGFDGLLNYYAGVEKITESGFQEALTEFTDWHPEFAKPYVVGANKQLINIFGGPEVISGITVSAPGFYGPQGRMMRLPLAHPGLNERLEQFRFGSERITNYEMESSAIYGLSNLLGHRAVTICAIIANRITGDFLRDYKNLVKKLIGYTVDRLTL